MLSCGCLCGGVQIDLQALTTLFGAVLPLSVPLEREESRSTIINSSGISNVDLALILPVLKRQTLRCMSALMKSPRLTLSKAASGIIRPLCSLLALPCASDALQADTFGCFTQAAGCFPTLVPTIGSVGVASLLSLLEREIRMITASADKTSSLSAAERGSSSSSTESVSSGRSVMVMSTVESILLFCGGLLPRAIRESVELLVAEALVCLCKGIVQPSLGK